MKQLIELLMLMAEKIFDCVLFGKPYPEEIQMEVKN